MGQKINPIGFRLGINRGWDSTWFAKKKDFGKYLIEDFKMREYIKKNITNSGVSEIIIERSSNKIIYAHSFGDDMFHGRFMWLNDERIGVAAAKRFGGLAAPREIGQFLAFNPDGSKMKMIIGDVTQRATRVSRSSVGRSYFEIVSIDEYIGKTTSV